MKRPTNAEQKAIVEQWKRAAPALQQARDEELENTAYDWTTVDALLDIGAKAPRREDEPNGLVEMQKRFMKLARKQGLLPAVREEADAYAPDGRRLVSYGNATLPPGPKLGLLCSVKCPGKLILDTYDLCQRFRDLGVTVVSGFRSPMEQECLRILLRSPHSVIWCLARGMVRQLPSKPVDCRTAVAEGRLVLVSPFANTISRVTARTAMVRNRFVADLATAIVVPHAARGGKTEMLCRDLLASGKPLFTFDHPANAALIQAGARPITPETDWLHVDRA